MKAYRQDFTAIAMLVANGDPARMAVADITKESKRQTDWAERDLALILTALLAGLRAEELRQANVGDILRAAACR